MDRSLPEPRGILHPAAGERTFTLSRHLPAPDLERAVEFHWLITWDLRGRPPYAQETLPHPCVHLVFERGRSYVYGVETGKFTRVLEGAGRAFAVKFTPGGFHPFAGVPIARLTNTTLPATDIFGSAAIELERAIVASDDEREMVALVEEFLRARLPACDDPQAAVVRRLVARIAAEREITAVDDVVALAGIGKRTLQRLFREYVGVSPKWVIQRYRLHEVAARLDRGDRLDWPRLVVELGYADQAHLIRDFKAIVGRTPAAYARRGAAPRPT
jgi:AraC-like DNA-binding protein